MFDSTDKVPVVLAKIKFLKRQSSSNSVCFAWPIEDEIQDLSLDNILQVLSSPLHNRRGLIYFNCEFKIPLSLLH